MRKAAQSYSCEGKIARTHRHNPFRLDIPDLDNRLRERATRTQNILVPVWVNMRERVQSDRRLQTMAQLT